MTETITKNGLTKEYAQELLEKYTYMKKYHFNFFNELAKVDKNSKGINEVCHSKILAMLLNAGGKDSNSFQYQFLKNFISKLNGLNISNTDDFVQKMSKDLVVETEYNNIDILLYSKNADFVCVIENKIDCELGKDQLKRYVEVIQNSPFSNYSYKKFVYLRRYFDNLSAKDQAQIEANKYQELEYSDIALMIDNNVLGCCSDVNAYFSIKQYKEFINLYWYETIDNIWIDEVKKILK